MAKRAEEIRLAPLLLRLEEVANLHRRGLMSDSDYEKFRSAINAEIAGLDSFSPKNGKSDLSVGREARQMRADEFRAQVDQLARQMKSNPNQLPEDYFRLASSLPPKFTREVGEQDEWRNAGSGPMQEYYNTWAGRNVEDLLSDPRTKKDANNNPIGTEYDLPRDGTLQECTLVLCWFSKEGQYGKPVEALRCKGFHVIVHDIQTSTEQQMMVSLLIADVAWLVSGAEVTEAWFGQLLDAMVLFHRRGGGLMVWGDNAPHIAHANQLLVRIFPGDGIYLEGNDHGSQIMIAHSEGTSPGHLSRNHLIMTGLKELFEGVTISYLPRVGPLKVIATYNHGLGYSGRPYCAAADAEVFQRCRPPNQPGRGRVVIDGGFTKLYDEYWMKTAGTERYVKNASAWLLNMNSRVESEEDIAERFEPTVRTSSPSMARNPKRTYRA